MPALFSRGFSRMAQAKNIQEICIVGGGGHVGLPLALVLADRGFNVTILDINKQTLDTILSGKMPFLEHGGEELLRKLLPTGRLKGTSDNAVVSTADVVICVIGTSIFSPCPLDWVRQFPGLVALLP